MIDIVLDANCLISSIFLIIKGMMVEKWVER